MAEFVDGRLPTSSAPLSQRTDALNGGDKRPSRIDLGPLIGAQRGFRTREKSPLNGGMNGVEMISPLSAKPGATPGSHPLSKGHHPSSLSHIKEKVPVVQATSVTTSPNDQSEEKIIAQEATNTLTTPDLRPSSRGQELRDTADIATYRSPSPSDSDPPPHSEDEEQMPPKMRKRWIHRSTEGLRSASPFPSSCGSNDSLGSVLDESQMSIESPGVNAAPLNVVSSDAPPIQMRRKCLHPQCQQNLTPLRSYRFHILALHAFSPANFLRHHLIPAPHFLILSHPHPLRHLLIYRYYRRLFRILPTRLLFPLSYQLRHLLSY